MARRKLTNPKRAVTYRLDSQLIDTYALLLQDPCGKRGAYGKKSHLVGELLTRLLDATKQGELTINVSDLTKTLRGE